MVNELCPLEVDRIDFVVSGTLESCLFCIKNWAKLVENQRKLSKLKMLLIKSRLIPNFFRIFRKWLDRVLG